jgi:hypothetical protein
VALALHVSAYAAELATVRIIAIAKAFIIASLEDSFEMEMALHRSRNCTL